VSSYIKVLLNEMHLWGWRVILHPDQPDTENDARISTCDDRKIAHLYLADDFFTFDRDQQRQTLVHEMLHLHESGPSDIVRKDLSKHLGQSTYDVVWANYARQCEFMVDELANVIAPFMPLCDLEP
jgi:hypothetical protein